MSCRLNHDCIRDILLFMEDKMGYKNSFITMEQIIDGLKDKYDEDCIDYHFRLMSRTGFFASKFYSDGMGRFSGFSWEGHEYLDNIRDQEAWTIVKNATKDLNSISLDVIKELAKEVIMSLGKKGLKKLLE